MKIKISVEGELLLICNHCGSQFLGLTEFALEGVVYAHQFLTFRNQRSISSRPGPHNVVVAEPHRNDETMFG